METSRISSWTNPAPDGEYSRGFITAVKFKTTFAASIVGVTLCAALSLAAQKKGASSSASSIFVQDKGKLSIKLAGQTVGHEEFEIAPTDGGWLAKGTSEIKPPEGATSKVTGSLAMQPDGSPISYDWTSQAGKTNGAHIIFANGVAKISLAVQGARPFEQD